jgi:hypothetical protein
MVKQAELSKYQQATNQDHRPINDFATANSKIFKYFNLHTYFFIISYIPVNNLKISS